VQRSADISPTNLLVCCANVQLYIQLQLLFVQHLCTWFILPTFPSNLACCHAQTCCVCSQRPYPCGAPGCDKRYTDPSSLRKHQKCHTSMSNFFDVRCFLHVYVTLRYVSCTTVWCKHVLSIQRDEKNASREQIFDADLILLELCRSYFVSSL